MKKVFGLIFLLFSFIIISALVSAQYGFSYGVSSGFSWIENNIGPYFSYVLGGTSGLLFERVMLFFVLMCLIFVILRRMKVFSENMAVIWIITLAVSLLATRYMSDLSVVKNVLLPYSVLGVSLGAAIPFIIYFFFVHSFEDSSTLRKILWIFFIVVFLGLWADRQNELGDLSYIYILTGLVALICLLFDGTIRRALLKEKQKQNVYRLNEESAIEIRKRLVELEKNKREGIVDEGYYYKMRKSLQKQMRDLYKH